MQHRAFDELLDETFERIRSVLKSKSDEYADESDKLRNFKKAANLQDISPIEALSGMMAKHTVSVYDLMMDTDDIPDLDKWDEKIVDHLNYLILLRALVVERLEGKNQ